MLSPGPIVGPACKYTARAAYDCEITVSRSRTGRHPIAHLKTSSPSHLVRFFPFFFRSLQYLNCWYRLELRYGRERTKHL